jgi:hypothetical protein
LTQPKTKKIVFDLQLPFARPIKELVAVSLNLVHELPTRWREGRRHGRDGAVVTFLAGQVRTWRLTFSR